MSDTELAVTIVGFLLIVLSLAMLVRRGRGLDRERRERRRELDRMLHASARAEFREMLREQRQRRREERLVRREQARRSK